MRLSSVAACVVMTALIAGAGCQSTGAGNSGGWRVSRWNPTNWSRGGIRAKSSDLAGNGPVRPSTTATPSMSVSPGSGTATAGALPTTGYPATAASYNAPGSRAGASGRLPLDRHHRLGRPYMAPQAGRYGAGNYAEASTGSTPPGSSYPSTAPSYGSQRDEPVSLRRQFELCHGHVAQQRLSVQRRGRSQRDLSQHGLPEYGRFRRGCRQPRLSERFERPGRHERELRVQSGVESQQCRPRV